MAYVIVSARILPYYYYDALVAKNITVVDTKNYASMEGFMWSDAMLDFSGIVLTTSKIMNETKQTRCSDTDSPACRAGYTSVLTYAKICAIPIISSNASVVNYYQSPTNINATNVPLDYIPAIALCVWVSKSYSGGDPPTPPSSFDCNIRCMDRRQFMFNSIRIEGEQWRSTKGNAVRWKTLFTYNLFDGYLTYYNELYDSIMNASTVAIESATNMTLLRDGEGRPVTVQWGDEPIPWMADGYRVSGIVAAVVVAAPLVLPFIFFNIFYNVPRRSRRRTRGN